MRIHRFVASARLSQVTAFASSLALGLALAATAPAQIGGTLTPLASFSSSDLIGETPFAGLALAPDGNYYGTAFSGGANGLGSIFRVTPDGTVSVFASFDGTHGADPKAPVTPGALGDFYGTTRVGGANSLGAIYRCQPDGSLVVLHSFDGVTDGEFPEAGLILGSDGSYYGATSQGAAAGYGMVFKIAPDGTFTPLHTFTGTNDGAEPRAGLIQANDGNFYGTTAGDGAAIHGSVYKIALADGTFTPLHNFDGDPADGIYPLAGLAQAGDGNLYGTTNAGGDLSNGTAFRIALDGSGFASLHSFTNSLGGAPASTLVVAIDGKLYGTTTVGSPNNNGTIYQLTTGGAVSTVHSFTDAEGKNATGGLIEGPDGRLFGTTSNGVGSGTGGVFAESLYPNGEFQFSAPFYNYNEFGSLSTATVKRIFGAAGATSVHYATYDNTAMAGVDYESNSGTLTWADGDATDKTFTVKILDQGITTGDLRSLNLALFGAEGNAGIGNPAVSVLNIFENDQNVITSPATTLGTLGQPFTYQILATGHPTVFTASGLPPGLTLDTATGIISGTPTVLGTTDVPISAGGATGTAVGSVSITITVLPVAKVTANSPQVVVGSGSFGEFTITLSTPPTVKTFVYYRVRGTAKNGEDYTLLSGRKKFKAGVTSRVVKIYPSGGPNSVGGLTVALKIISGTGYELHGNIRAKVQILPAP